MAKTVSAAFDEFLKDFVRIDKGRNEVAKSSKSNLISEIERFPNDGVFFKLYPGMTSIDFGSYSRKTKIRELDDIDIMIVMNAEGNWREPLNNGGFLIKVPSEPTRQNDMCNLGTNVLNSTKVINRFKDYLGKVSSYEMATIKRNQEAVTLKLKSYEWVYDIVPCFMTNFDFFLIPDGKGNWKPTDPRIDKERIVRINSSQSTSILDVVRLLKYWTKRRTAATMGSYFLECLILNHYEGISSGTEIDIEIRNMFAHIYHTIHSSLNDPKGYQGDLNTLSWSERDSIQSRAKLDYNKAVEAISLKNEGKHKESIAKWIEVFGSDFPGFQ